MTKRIGTELKKAQNEKPAGAPRFEIDVQPEPEAEEQVAQVEPACYVAAFKVQRAEHIAARFGTAAKQQMLNLVSGVLKGILGANDRLLRWKGTSFVMFLNSTGSLNEIRVVLSEAVERISQQYIEVGKNSALISVVVDWTVFPQAQCPSLDAVFTEVDVFLAGDAAGSARDS